MSGTRGGRGAAPRGPVLRLREAYAAVAGMRRLRGDAELTKAGLAERLGTPSAWVKDREQMSVRMTRAEAERVAAAFGTDYDGLLAAGKTEGAR